MGVEIERKFLVDHAKWEQLSKPKGTDYSQGYITDDPATIRVRIAGEHAYLTIKGTSVGFTRNEYEYEIPVVDAHELLESFAGERVEKIRYEIPVDDVVWEVDVFKGANEGLVIAEVELNSEDHLINIPEWVGEEVTGNKKYYNSRLAKNPYKNWQAPV